ncbi:lebercilin [Thalassophryne amazonica]|uniref:lebercilin n=1 Tax=Thalassophryne amazonica TaxID=390379 RepID=UPI0014725F42|nr:lebercilin [Thalassophryne amazonica]
MLIQHCCPVQSNMENENSAESCEENRKAHQSLQSHRSTKNDSRASSFQKLKRCQNRRHKILKDSGKEDCAENRSKSHSLHSDPDRDQISDEGRRSSGSFYLEDFENDFVSDHSLSSYSQSQGSSPNSQRGMRSKKMHDSPADTRGRKGGVGRHVPSHLRRPGCSSQSQLHRGRGRSHSKDSTPPKDLDLVTKNVLSARLLKINELRNAVTEQQLQIDELQKENRILKKLQVRQEKALQRYDDTGVEISQLLSRHSNETLTLREHVRRAKEQQRAAERQLKDSDERLQRSRATVARLKTLVAQHELAPREELSRRLEEETTRRQDGETKIKELERKMELMSGSYQRQLAAERKKCIGAQEKVAALQEELKQLTDKLKEKERERDALNIYARHAGKPSTNRKDHSSSSTKAVQTEDNLFSTDFPPPPPTVTEGIKQADDEYLSLKERDRPESPAQAENTHQNWDDQQTSGIKRENDKEKQQVDQQQNGPEKKEEKQRDGWGRQTGEYQEDDSSKKNSHVREEVERWNQEAQSNCQAAEENHHQKEQLLEKMRKIDLQNQAVKHQFGTSERRTPRFSEQETHNLSVFSLTEPDQSSGLRFGSGSREGGRRKPAAESGGVRPLQSQTSREDLSFGSYTPSFGVSTSRYSPGFPPPPPKKEQDSPLEAVGVFNLELAEKDKVMDRRAVKSNLMQQLFGTQTVSAGENTYASNSAIIDIFNSHPTSSVIRAGRRCNPDSSPSPAAPHQRSLHVTDSRPAVCAVPSFDNDIEELTL